MNKLMDTIEDYWTGIVSVVPHKHYAGVGWHEVGAVCVDRRCDATVTAITYGTWNHNQGEQILEWSN